MGVTPIDLYRSGNNTSPKLDNVRISGTNSDVDTFVDAANTVWVLANGKGVSSSDAIDPSWSGKPWRLPMGSPFPDGLRLWEDDPGHYVWEPAMPMPLANYVSFLAQVMPLFVKV
jgi:hypothetical protein